MTQSLKAGDVVRLKSGGPQMTIAQVIPADQHYPTEPRYRCEWFADGKEPLSKIFPASTLTLADG